MSPQDTNDVILGGVEDHSFPFISSPRSRTSLISDSQSDELSFESSCTSPQSRHLFHENPTLGTMHNTETTSDIVRQKSVSSQQTITENVDGRKPDTSPALTTERVIEIALMRIPHRKRSSFAPEAFDTYGRLKTLWTHLQGDIDKTKKERDAQAREERKAKAPEKRDRIRSPQLTEQHSSLKIRFEMPPNTTAEPDQHQRPHSLRSRQPADPSAKSPAPTSHPQDAIFLNSKSSKLSPTFPKLHLPVVPNETARIQVASKPEMTPKPVQPQSQAPSASPKQSSDFQGSPNKVQETWGEIRCSMPTCNKKRFDSRYLQKEYGIQLVHAQENLRQNGFWLCPVCFNNIEVAYAGQYKNPMQPSTNRTELGEEWLDDDEIRSPLTQLFGRVMQYTARACNRRWPRPKDILEISCIRDEGHIPSAASNAQLVGVMREMLDVQPGITVIEKIRSFQIESGNSLWIKAILCFMVTKFIFENGSPFDDPLILLNSLSHIGDGPRTFAEMLQRDRIRTMSTTPHPPTFASRIQDRRDVFVRNLNAVMMPLVGSTSEINSDHIAITKIAEDLNLKISAYKGNYRPIWPKMGHIFDAKEHIVEDLDSKNTESKAGEEKRILSMTMVGVKVELPEGDWRVCSQAKVRLWPPAGFPVEKGRHPSAAQGKKRAREE